MHVANNCMEIQNASWSKSNIHFRRAEDKHILRLFQYCTFHNLAQF